MARVDASIWSDFATDPANAQVRTQQSSASLCGALCRQRGLEACNAFLVDEDGVCHLSVVGKACGQSQEGEEIHEMFRICCHE